MNTIQAELLPLRWSITSKGGSTLVLQVSSEDELEQFKGMIGKRLQGVFVEIADDETALPAPQESRPDKKNGPLCQWAVMRCKEPEFQTWICQKYLGLFYGSEENAKRAIYNVCGIESRIELDTTPEAAKRFHTMIREPYLIRHMEAA